MLCIWHINKNVLINYKRSFVIVEKWKKFLLFWYAVVYAHTREKYEKIWIVSIVKYNIDHSAKMNYLHKIWLSYIKRFCQYRINKFLHLNILIIFRMKENYRILKIMLKFFIENFLLIVDKIKILLIKQYKAYITTLNQIKMKNSIDWITFHCLKKYENSENRWCELSWTKKTFIVCWNF